MLSITNLREGALLNSHRGIETADGLIIKVDVMNSFGTPVKVNGVPAEQNGLSFQAEIKLTQKINKIEAVTITPYGEFSQKLTVVWDKKSFRRCRFYIDDHSFLFTELAKQRPARAFDHFYLKKLREFHNKYGLKVILNSFYRNDHEEFELKDMPDIWKSEFADNADWLKFALHAYSEFPDRPYADASRKKFLEDYELMEKEVSRFAGNSAYIVPAVLHWNNLSPGVADELIKKGCTCYSESMRTRIMATPPEDELTEKEKAEEFRSEVYVSPVEPMARHFGFAEEIDYLDKYGALYDQGLGIFFYHDWIVCNLLRTDEIPRLFKQTFAKAERYGNDLFSACGHEQYSFPHYFNYQADHFEKLEETIRLMAEDAGCSFVFFQEGLLGNTAWEK